MALARLRGRPAIDTERLPMVSTATKMVASFAAILFSMATFIVTAAAGRLALAALAAGFALVAILRPSSPKVGIRVLAWLAAAFAAGAVVIAAVDLVGAGPPPSPQIGP